MSNPRVSVLGELRVHGREVEILVRPWWTDDDLRAAAALHGAPVRFTVEPAAATPIRSAEEVAREVVTDPQISCGLWWSRVGTALMHPKGNRIEADEAVAVARATVAAAITRAREEGAATERERAATEAYAAQFYSTPEDAAAAWAKFTGKPAPARPRFCSCGKPRPLIDGTLCKCLDCGGFCDLADPEPRQPRDLAGRSGSASTPSGTSR